MSAHPSSDEAGTGPRKQKRQRKKGELLPYLLILPAIVAIAAVYLYPLSKTVIMSFQDMGRRELWTGEAAPWVGFEQFTNILGDSEFWWVTFRTVVFMAVCVTLTMGLGLLISLLMRRLTTWVRLVLTFALIAAWSMPLMVAASVFRFMADSDYGLINTLIAKVVGEDWLGHNWYLDPIQGFAIITLLVVWGAIPFVVVTLYAALTQVPKELEEAASLDGAGETQMFLKISLPMTTPILAVNALTAFIASYGSWEWAILVCQREDYWTLAVWLYQLTRIGGNTPQVILAAFVVASLPTAIVFIACQKVILRGIVIPAMK